MTTIEERSRGVAWKLRWIAELEEKLAGMREGWPVAVLDGARVFSFAAFGEWSPELDALRTIRELKGEIYGLQSVEALDAKARMEEAKDRVAGCWRMMIEWPEERMIRAVSECAAVLDRARVGLRR